MRITMTSFIKLQKQIDLTPVWYGTATLRNNPKDYLVCKCETTEIKSFSGSLQLKVKFENEKLNLNDKFIVRKVHVLEKSNNFIILLEHEKKLFITFIVPKLLF